jgi:exopolysaccharide biosynthesis polyprenyl glycosylphosphotransferase
MGQITVQSATNAELAGVQPLPLPWATQRRRGWPQISLATDVAMLASALLCAVILTRASGTTLSIAWGVVLTGMTLLALNRKRLHRPPLRLGVIDTLAAVVTACVVAASLTIALRVLLTDPQGIASESLTLGLATLVFVVFGRLTLTLCERRARRSGASASPALIVGAGEVGQCVARRLSDTPELGLRPVGFLDKEPLASGDNGLRISVLGASWDFDQVVREHQVEDVVFTFSTAPTDVYLRLVKRCQQLGLRASIVPRLYEKATEDTTVASLGGVPLVVRHARDPKGWEFAVKYAIDRVGAVLMLALLSPLFATLSLAVLISLGRPILYRQERIGLDGKRFAMLKFRSMRPAEPEDEADETFVLDPDNAPGGVEGRDRRTRVGAFIRHFSLDELPQVINVAKGEMSFVGPRPERPEYVELFEQRVRNYGERHRVKSGITGWAQVHGLRGQTSIADRAEWDNYYIENWSLRLDLRILVLTAAAVVRAGMVE